MSLLYLLAGRPGVELIAAHFNHGIREAALADEEFVRQAASRLGLAFEAGQAVLGRGASEEAARQARYDFLFHIQQKYQADAVITAHHQDDMIETALINLLRGTGRKGLVAISHNPKVLRPLLNYPKRSILEYAQSNGLEWREDETNNDEGYLRNYVRRHIMDKLGADQREQMVKNIDKVAKKDKSIDGLIANISHTISNEGLIDRAGFSALPVNLGEELVIFWLRQNKVRQFDQKTVNRLGIALRTAQANTVCSVQGDITLLLSQKTARFSQGV